MTGTFMCFVWKTNAKYVLCYFLLENKWGIIRYWFVLQYILH